MVEKLNVALPGKGTLEDTLLWTGPSSLNNFSYISALASVNAKLTSSILKCYHEIMKQKCSFENPKILALKC
jgi:hypothetical protein